MATFTKVILSGSTDGQFIDVTASEVSTAVTTIHSGPSTTSVIDEVYLWAQNNNSSCNVKLSVFVGTSSTKTLIEQNILPEQGLIEIVPGLPIQGNATPLVISAFRDNSGVAICGYVNRIDQT